MLPGRRVVLSLCLFSAVGLFPAVRAANAHAVLLESSPSLKSTIAGPDVPIELRFNVRIDAIRSRLTLIAPNGTVQPLEIRKQVSADTLSSEASGLLAGVYRLRWQVLASDGHITRGEILFTVMRT
ncbi:MAG TPA: copper resistance CopC family protein [Candidatus Acidoferrum sp.]|nr:copper resistance CopC family protein [Candidatus Acidoferrum sp.]